MKNKIFILLIISLLLNIKGFAQYLDSLRIDSPFDNAIRASITDGVFFPYKDNISAHLYTAEELHVTDSFAIRALMTSETAHHYSYGQTMKMYFMETDDDFINLNQSWDEMKQQSVCVYNSGYEPFWSYTSLVIPLNQEFILHEGKNLIIMTEGKEYPKYIHINRFDFTFSQSIYPLLGCWQAENSPQAVRCDTSDNTHSFYFYWDNGNDIDYQSNLSSFSMPDTLFRPTDFWFYTVGKSCERPEFVNITDPSPNGCYIYWYQTYGNGAVIGGYAWEVAYKTINSAQWQTDTSYSLVHYLNIDLSEEEYMFKVRTICDMCDSISNWSDIIYFKYSDWYNDIFDSVTPHVNQLNHTNTAESHSSFGRQGWHSSPSGSLLFTDHNIIKDTAYYDKEVYSLNTPMNDTVFYLKGVPEGYDYSVRMETNKSIIYSFEVDTNKFDLFLFHYALVADVGDDIPNNYNYCPVFGFNLLTPLDKNTAYSANKACDSLWYRINQNDTAWHKIQHPNYFGSKQLTKFYRPWQATSTDISDYHGKRLYFICFNWAKENEMYSYFRAHAIKKTQYSSLCDEIIEAPIGFKYEWYKENSTQILSEQRTFSPTTAGTYRCKLISYDFPNCNNEITFIVSPAVCDTSFDTICNNVPYDFNGQILSKSGVYYDTLTSTDGIDSINVLNLTVFPSYDTTIQITACNNYTDNDGRNYTQSGIYTDSLLTLQGCDSIVNLDLTISIDYYDTITAFGCDTGYYDNNFTVEESGFYSLNLKNEYGCDSVLNLDYTRLPLFEDTIHADIIKGQTYSDENFSESEKGTYTVQFTSANGCDSVIVLDLNVTDLKFPNVITPNADGINDIFEINGLLEQTYYKEIHLIIYNRYGKRIFETQKIETKEDFWNPAATNTPTGTYFYRFTAKGSEKNLDFVGVIEVIR